MQHTIYSPLNHIYVSIRLMNRLILHVFTIVIHRHFIGSLQSNKVKPLLRDVPNLECIQTVSSEKLATKISNAVSDLNRGPFDVYVQIDTSGEDSKSGVPPEEATNLVTHIVTNCPNISIKGLMTIGAPGDLSCFDKLVEVREEVSRFLRVDSDSLELSMGNYHHISTNTILVS